MKEKPRPPKSECGLGAVAKLEKFWKQRAANYSFLDNPWLKMGMSWWCDNAQSVGECKRILEFFQALLKASRV